MLLSLASAYAVEHIALRMNSGEETKVHDVAQKVPIAEKVNNQTQKQVSMVQDEVRQDRKERKMLPSYSENQDTELRKLKKQENSNSLLQEVNIRQLGISQSKICEKSR